MEFNNVNIEEHSFENLALTMSKKILIRPNDVLDEAFGIFLPISIVTLIM